MQHCGWGIYEQMPLFLRLMPVSVVKIWHDRAQAFNTYWQAQADLNME